jgi:hypothetical protein
LEAALDAMQDTPLGYRSEFSMPSVLEPLFSKHPNWPRLRQCLTVGSDWVLDELSEEQRVSDLKEAIERGNHKGAVNDPEQLKKLVNKDVTYAYTLPIALDKVLSIPGICMAPVNIAPQNTIDEFGRI